MMAIEQGRAAVYLSKHIQALKDPEADIEESLNVLNDHLIQSVLHVKKAKLQPFIVESYFLAFHAFEVLR